MKDKTIVVDFTRPDENSHGFRDCMFRISSPIETTIFIEKFEDGIAYLDKASNDSIHDLQRIANGCFHLESNFAQCVLAAFGCPEDTMFRGIYFTIDGVLHRFTVDKSQKWSSKKL